jgi:transcriptional regulator with XRE-family HTH domain
MARLGPTIRDLRLSARMTQEDVHARSGISRSYISRLEQGDIVSPSADYLHRIAHAIGVLPDMLFAVADYRGSASPPLDESRAELLQWFAQETAEWSETETRFWLRIVLQLRTSRREYEAELVR